MSKFTLAARLADELGTSVSKASRFIDDVGAPAARNAADQAAAAGSRTVSKWWKPAAAGTGIIGGGSLVWRQQDLREAEAIAGQQQSYTNALQAIIESDLPPEVKQDLIDQLNNGGGDSDDEDDEDEPSGLKQLLSELFGGDGSGGLGSLMGGAQQTVILLVVVVLVLNYALSRSSTIGTAPVSSGGGA